jgi:hypothetical protein
MKLKAHSIVNTLQAGKQKYQGFSHVGANCCSRHSVQKGSGTEWVSTAPFMWIKWPGHTAKPSPPSSAVR